MQIICNNISFKHDNEYVFKNINLNINNEDIVLLMGASGSGKSSLAMCIAGLYPEYSGKLKGDIFINNTNIRDLDNKSRAKLVSIMFQNPDDQFCMDTVKNEIIFALENIDCPTREIENRVDYALRLSSMHKFKDTLISSLSGGLKQKVSLAVIIAIDPELIILDEPFSNIDSDSSKILLNNIKSYTNAYKKSVIIIDHKLKPFKDFATKVMIMENSGEYLKNPLHMHNIDNHISLFNRLGLYHCQSSYIPRKKIYDSNINIKINSLSVTYNRLMAINNIDLNISSSSITTILGKCGSGKTTLLFSLAKLIKYKGCIELSNGKQRIEKNHIGLIFQNPSYQFLTLKVIDELMYTMQLNNNNYVAYDLEQKAEKLLDSFKLLSYRDRSPYMLSQGEQRRLALLCILCSNKKIFLIDEPTYGQDEKNTMFIINYLINKVKRGAMLIMTTHDQELAAAYADTLIYMDNGKIKHINKKVQSL